MRGWAGELLAPWHTESITLSSPMPIDVARPRLSGGLPHPGHDTIWRTGAKIQNRTNWRPVLRGRLLPTESGCTFIGALG